MDSITISEFKATCLRVIDQIKKTGQSVLVTKNGEPAAIVSPPIMENHERTFGAFKGELKIIGDIIEPVAVEDWEALK